MKRPLLIFLTIAVVILIAVLIYIYFKNKDHENELILYGNVDVRQVDIGFRVAGQVESLYFEEGDLVKAGDLVATLNYTPYTSQVKQAKWNVKSIKASLENSEKLVKRRNELIGVGGISQENLDDAQTNVNTFRANLEAAEAALQVAKDNLTYTKVYAPTDGVILTRIREPGTVVNPSDPVYTLSVSSPVWIRAFVSEPNLGMVYYGMPADIYIDTHNAPVYTGRIGFISPISEFTPKTVETTQLRTDLVYRLRIYVDNPDHILKQGMPVTVKLQIPPELRRKGE